MRALLSLVVITAAVVLGGCANNDAAMASWQGHHYNDVIAAWGPPAQVMDDPPGKIMSWTSTRTVYMPLGNSVVGQNRTASRTFWVDASGIIYRWAWRGN